MAVNIGPRIGIDGEAEYRKQIHRIIQETKTLKSEYEKVSSTMEKGSTTLKGNAEQHRILSEQIKVQEQRVKDLSDMVEKSSAKFGEADQKTLKWKEALYTAETELNNLRQELKDLPSQIELIGTKMESAGKKISETGRNIEGFGRALAPISAAATAGIVGSTKAAVDFETAMTGVEKTNDELVDSNGNVIISYDDLAESIKKMSTETASSKEDIAAVMEAAGQLGVGTQYLEDFTKTMVMMGDSTNLSADEAASAIAKFANVTGMSLDDSQKLGSVIVALGNNFATTETDIVDMATRLSGAGHQIGLTEAQIMGFATALSSVGIEAEMGGSAFSKAMIKMEVASETGYDGYNKFLNALKQTEDYKDVANMSFRDMYVWLKNESTALKDVANATGYTKKELNQLLDSRANLENFAEVSNVTAEEFVQTFKNDAPAAIQAFISGLGDIEGKGETTIQMLEEMGFTEVRLRDTLTRMASSGNLVTDAVGMASDAWEKNIALTDEAEKKYGTTAAQMSQAKEKLTNIGIEIGERLLPYLDKGLDVIDKLITAWDGLSVEEQDQIVQAALLTAAAAPVITATGKVVEGVGAITSASGGALKALGSLSGVFGSTGAAASSLGTGAGAASTGIAGIAAPAGVAVAALAVLGGAFVTAYKNDEEFAKTVDKDWAEIKQSITEVIKEVEPVWKAFSNGLSPVFTEAMNSIDRRIDIFKNGFKGFVTAIDGIIEGDWRKALNGFLQVESTIMNSALETIRSTANAIEGVFNKMDIQFPHIKLPHFYVRGTDSWGLPSIGIDWYAKAMQAGMRLTSPTIFGAANGSLMAGGEAGNEWVVGESSILNMIRSAVHQAVGYVPDYGNTITIGDTTIVINAAPGQDVEEIADAVDDILTTRYQQARQAWG